jgi:5'-nucleotidase
MSVKKSLRILVTNDDGISAIGLEVLERIARTLSDDIWVVAPEQEQSGAGHSLTLHLPVRLRKIDARRYAVSGTPTDCVLLALQQVIPISKKPVDLILSGVNRGSNAADDVTYSGTVAAAMEGTILEVPSIALSQLYEDPESIHWGTAEKHAPDLIRKLFSAGWPHNTLVNINFPDCPPAKVKGIRVCPQGKRQVSVALSERVDPKGRPYFWIGGDRDNSPDRPGVDVDLLHKGYVTVTPLCMDMTHYKTMDDMRKACVPD